MNNVNHPSHYNIPGKKECIVQMREDYGETITAIFCLTNAYKYLYRAGHKGDKKEDIEKAKWYFNYLEDVLSCDSEDVNYIQLYHDIQMELRHYD